MKGPTKYLVAQAAIDFQLQSDELIAQLQVADQPQLSLSKVLVDVFVQHQRQAAQHHGQPVTARLVVQQLLDDALLAAHAQQQYSTQQLWPQQRVGFDYQVDRQRQQLRNLIGRDFHDFGDVKNAEFLDGVQQQRLAGVFRQS